MTQITMEPAAPPKAGQTALYAHGRQGAYFFSFGDLDLVCGDCGFVLFRGLPRAGQRHTVLAECPGCRSFMTATIS